MTNDIHIQCNIIVDLRMKGMYVKICIRYVGLYVTLKYLSLDIYEFREIVGLRI